MNTNHMLSLRGETAEPHHRHHPHPHLSFFHFPLPPLSLHFTDRRTTATTSSSEMNNTNLLHLKPQLTNPHLFFSNPYRKINQFRPYKRRRLKLCCVNNGSSYNILDALNSFFSQFPSPNSPQILAPVLALVPGLTLYLSRSKSKAISKSVGDWILCTSPTPFNRFVILRCPSISLEGSEFLENVNEKLVQEDRHFVRLNKGRIHGVTRSESFELLGEKLDYQRVCVNTEDGGVISIDWPANLELEEEYGLDTTLLLVPGTPRGSMEENVRGFVVDALKRGFFPVVMNPRGCAGSPVTTARLFTAADSDDICTAIQFISKARPWTTLMGVGWGYGANMLTKYLAEVGERTPLTAATCINNPFDLEEATRCSPYHVALDHKLTGGLIDILQSNKEMFQGRAKGFDVEKALLSKSVRDFEEAISMVSYGFEEICDFYSKSSTRDMVGNVKIPVLFIQSDDGTVPLFSIPRSLIAKNPFTSLLLCSCVPSSVVESGRAAVSWCQNLTIEWLTAVELGLLKGRHPLLKDVDVNINPSKGLTLVEGEASDKRVRLNKLSGLTLTDANGYVEPIKKILQDRNNAVGLQSRSKDSFGNLELKGPQEGQNSAFQQRRPVNAELIEQDSSDPGDTEKGQVLQTAKVVMNILDATMPGTLSEQEKEKVLTAVGQGETVMKALQDAVPEEVRGKLTTAVSGILNAPHPNLKIDGLLGIRKIPNESKTKIPEVSKVSSAEGMSIDPQSLEQMKRAEDFTDGSGNNESAAEKSGAGLEPELRTSKNTQKSTNTSQSQAMSSKQGDSSGSVRKELNEMENKNESDKGKAASYSNSSEKALETSENPNISSRAENADGTEEAIVDNSKVDQDGGIPQLETKRKSNTQKIEEKTTDSSADQSRTVSANTIEETLSPAGSSLDSQPVETEGSDDQKRENKVMQPAPDQHKPATPDSNPATFNVAQALDALTGMDDSTQVAVNSVFGVIENMISELEEKDGEAKVKDENEVKNEPDDSKPNKLESNNDVALQSDTLQHPPAPMLHENNDNLLNASDAGWLEGEPTENFLVSETDTSGSQGNNASNYEIKEKQKKDQLVSAQLLADNRHVNSVPLYISTNPYGDFLQNEYFRRYLLSKIPNTKPLDLDTTTSLLLDYFPEEGHWKLLEQPGTVGESIEGVITNDSADVKFQGHSSREVNEGENYVEPSYVVLDTEKQHKPVEEYSTVDYVNQVENGDDRSDYLLQFVKAVILDTLRTEVGRKLGSENGKEMKSKLATELEQVADAVSLAVGRTKDHTWSLNGNYHSIEGTEEKVGTIQGEHVVKAVSSAVLRTHYLRRFLPVGLVIGSSLAALRRYFNVATRSEDGLKSPDQTKKHGQNIQDRVSIKEIDHKPTISTGDVASFNSSRSIEVEEAALKNIKNDSVVVGAFTAALGASALLAQQQIQGNTMESEESPSISLEERGNDQKVANKLDEDESEKSQNKMVTSLAEKAMSVAGPVVPTKEDGEVDQDRLVAMLADLGQKGGILKLVGKVALLWGGIRSAMSLTDRLILFLHIAERPLYQRVLGFAGMVLVLWSPVVIPFLPTLVQSWTTSNRSRLAELVCIFGLYIAVMILVMLWGRRIRGYEDPLEQYGLNLTTFPKFQSFLRGLVGGVMLLVSIQSINALLGCVSFSWPSSLSSSSLNAITWLKVYGQVIMLAGRGLITATGVVLVEELLFRSWLPEEVAADLGYHRGIIISGLAFSLFQRSLWAVPGLWFFSLALAGFRQRSQGSLSFPIGLRTGIMASSFILQTGGFITYNPNYPVWLTGTHPLQPFSGVIGLAVSFLLAIMLYPTQPLQKKK